jgi:hypothetical protein
VPAAPPSPKPSSPTTSGQGPFEKNEEVKDAGKQLYCDRIPADKKGNYIDCGFSSTYKKIFYYKTKEAGKKVTYDYRRNAMIELFTESAEEYSKKIDKD